MKPISTFLLLVVLFAGCNGTPASPDTTSNQPETKHLLIPLRTGNHWSYDNNSSYVTSIESLDSVSRFNPKVALIGVDNRLIDTCPTWTVETSPQGSPLSIALKNDTLYLGTYIENSKTLHTRYIIPPNPSPGDTIIAHPGWIDTPYIWGTPTSVETPAGTFYDCQRAILTSTSYSDTVYFKRGVGIIKTASREKNLSLREARLTAYRIQ